MKTTFISALAFAASLSLAGAALGQASGGPDAKGNAPLKPVHTVNDGTPKRGANSFTQRQAQEHIEKSGFTGVSGLIKGDDGVWRGQAMRGGSSVPVAVDFKGNVSTSTASTSTSAGDVSATSVTKTTSTTTQSRTSASAGASPHHRRHHHHSACANPAPNGAACSGVDRDQNGISDKEDRAIKAGAKP